jgi:hypothetical protein
MTFIINYLGSVIPEFFISAAYLPRFLYNRSKRSFRCL